MKCTLLRALLLLFLTTGPSFAEQAPVPDDFAFGYQVDAEGEGPLFSVTLPLDFYRGVTKRDLSDLCLFNAQSEVVPFALQTPAVESSPHKETAALPIFPLFGEPDKALEGLSLQIRRDNSGAIIDVNTGETPITPQRKIVAYLLDASSLRRPIKNLELDWDPAAESFVGKVTVESSSDLDHWATRVRDATLASLRYGDHSLMQRSIQLNGVKAKYLRLSWPETRENVTLTTAVAEMQQETVERPLQWVTLDPASKAGKPTEFVFDALGPVPVNRVHVELPQPNTLLSASLLSRATEKDAWRPLCAGLIYQLTVKGENLASPDISLPTTTDRYWMLRIDEGSGGLGEGPPKLRLGWTPHRLVFISRGKMPFRLAFGSARVDPRQFHMDDALARLVAQNKDKMDVSPAHLGPRMILGGESRLRPPPFYSWKQWTLWTILLLGVLVMAWMATRLYKQMNRDSTQQKE